MLLNKKQTADRLSICVDTLMTLVSNGDILGFKVGGQWRFDERDIDNFINQQRQQAVHKAMKTGRKKTIKNNMNTNINILPVWMPGIKIQNVYGNRI